MSHLYDKFYEDPEYYRTKYYNNGSVAYKYYGEQNFVDENVENIVNLPNDWYSGKSGSSTARIIHYNGPHVNPL